MLKKINIDVLLFYMIPRSELCFNFFHICHGTFRNSRTPADLNALGPGYEFRPDLVTIPHSPLMYAFCTLGARNIGSNVRNDVAGPVT